MSTCGQLLKAAAERLSVLDYSDPVLEARELLGLVLGKDCRSIEFEAVLPQQAEEETATRLDELIRRRLDGEPLQYILGEWDFYGLRFFVGRGVLIPRLDTELIVELALKLYKNSDSLRILDLCAGSGCIGLALENRLTDAQLTLVENSPDALRYLEKNRKSLASKAEIVNGDVCSEELAAKFFDQDLIVCNPPYLTAEDMRCLQTEVRAEPEEALFGGEDGLHFYRTVTRLWKDSLKQGGTLLFEVGASQAEEVTEIMIQHGFRDVRRHRDLAGNYRAVIGSKR